jgi:uncharacterized protein YggU (UPF0235/DUF167 family)
MVRVHAPELGVNLPTYISERDGSAQVSVRLTPRAAREGIIGPRARVLAVKVSSPPVRDRANLALRKQVAKGVGIAPSRVQIVHGRKNREKVLRLEGVSAVDAAKHLAMKRTQNAG